MQLTKNMNQKWSQRLCQQALVSAILIVVVCCQQKKRLHISIKENDLLRYGDKAYVRIYQTVFSAAEGASKTTFPDKITYKDIWQDADGRIIIVPGDSLDNPTWVGIADPRNELKFLSNYKTQFNPADNPLVRSFVVDYETVQNVLEPRRIATEDPKYKGRGMSLNVDRHSANQFGLNHFDTDELRKNALPGSLVTYTSKSIAIDQTKYEHWGIIRPVEELYDKLGLPSDDIPGAYSDTQAKERTKGSDIQIDNYLQELETLQQKSKAGYNVESAIQDKLKEFNNKYVYEKISTRDLPIKGKNMVFEIQKLKKKLKTQITRFETELSKMYSNDNNVLYADVENKVNEYNEKFRGNIPKKLSPGELPSMKDAVSVQKQLLGEIAKLNELKGRFDAGENVKVEIDQRLEKYNDYMISDDRTLKRNDLENIKAYKEEAITRRQIHERFYKADLDPKLPNLDELEWKSIPEFETDPMFSGSKDINMEELKRKRVKLKKQFQGAKKFLAYVEAYSKELNIILKDDRSKDLNRVRNLRNAESLLRNSKDPQFLKRIKYGFFGGTDFSNDQITHILNDIGKTVAELIPNADKRMAVVGKLKTFTDKITKGLKQVTYNSEIIVQLGDSTEIDKASKYLFNRYKKEGKNVKHLIYDNDGLYRTVVSGMNVEVGSDTRISVIGHGKKTSSHLSIGDKDAVILARDLSQVILPTGSEEKLKVGKISLIACNVDANEGFEIGSRFGQKLVEALDSNNIQSVVTVRVGELQVTQDGYKLYGKLSNLHYRNKPPIIVRLTPKNGRMIPEYGIINTNTKTVQWNGKPPGHVENTKLFILSESFGSFDIAAIVEKTNLKSLQFVDENIKKSGALNFENKDIIIDTTGESQPKLSGIYLDMETSKDHVLPLADKTGIESVLMEVDAAVWLDKLLSVATGEVMEALPDSGNWIPLIDTAEINQEGNTKVTILDLKSRETQLIEMKNDVFVQFKKRSKRYAMYVRNRPKITKATIGMSGTGSVLGLAGFIWSAIQLANAKDCENNITCPSTEVGQKLAKSLEISGYIGFAMSTYGLIDDSVQIAELAVGFTLSKKAVNGIATMTKATSKFLQFSKVFGAVGMGVGSVGSVVGLGFSAYHLAHAETKAQKIQFGIQVGLDSVNLIVSGVAVGATITAAVTSSATASSLAAGAGPVGFVVAVVGILTSSITGLAFEFKSTRQNARQVGDYFYNLDNVYGQFGYKFDSSSNIFKILEHAIITSVDLECGVIQLDSQYIYRTRHGSSGSGKRNYFFWYKDFPELINDKHQAINIRERIGHRGRQTFSGARRAHTLILPAIPKSFISYSYSRLPFCTAMHDTGFDIIRRLERDDRFDYDFYIFPGEQIVSSIAHEYVDSNIRIKLTSNVKTIVVPNISDNKYKALHNKYTFKIITKSEQHTLILEDYYTFLLQRISSTPCSWYLSYANVNFNEVRFLIHSGWITIENVNIHVNKLDDKLYVFDDNGGILLLDPLKKTKTLTSIIHDNRTSSNELKNYLKTMNKDWLSKQQYVVIAKFRYNGEYMGRAFYDVDSEDFLFTNLQGVRVSNKFKDNVQLLAVFQDGVYFMSNETTDTVIWRVHAKTKKVVASYVLYCGNSEFQISKLSTQGDSTYLIQIVYDVSLVYMINANEIKLVFIDGLKEDIYKLADACFPSLHNLLQQRMSQTLSFLGKCIYASTIPILPIKQTLSNGTTNHFWLYMNDSQIPPDDKRDIFCPPSKPPVATGIITPFIENECDDLTLRDIQRLATGEEVYYFYCEGDKKKFYYQVGDNASVQAIFPGDVERIEDFGEIKLILSKNGGYYKFTGTSQFTLAALSFNSIAIQNNWKEAFNNIAKQALVESFIPVMNMKSIQKKDLTAWYDTVTDRLIIVSPSIDAQDIVYLGPSPSEFLIWLYNPHRRHVILQKILDDEEISKKIVRRNNEAYWNDELSPEATIVVSNANSVQYMQGSVFVVTKEGVMLSVDYLQAATFLGVNTTWIVNNNKSLALELERLCIRYQSGSPVTLGKQSANNMTDTVHRWYHCAMKCQVALTTNKNIQPVYLGMTQAKKMIFFFVGVDIIQIDVTGDKDVYSEGITISKVKSAIVRGKSLLLQTLDSLQLNLVPNLDNLRSLVVVTAYASKIILQTDDWLHYGNIVISSIGTAGPQLMHVNINPPFHCSFLFEEVENDTVIRDPISERVIVLEDFTVNSEKSDENYVPFGNEAVLRVQICDKKPVILVTNRERFDPMVSYFTGKDPEDSEDILKFKVFPLILTLVASGIFALAIVLFVKYRRNKSPKNNSYPEGHATSGKHRIELSQNKEGDETSL